MSFIKLIDRNRNSKDRISKHSSVSSISSHVPLMMTDKNDENLFLTQSLKIMSTPPDLNNFLQSFPMTASRDGKRSRTICQPKGTISYTINDGDTLEKVALHFDSTPSELLKLNKLSTRVIFPGQVIFVPEERSSNNCDKERTTGIKSSSSSFSSLPRSASPSTKNKDGNSFVLLADRRLTSTSTTSSVSLPLQQDTGSMVWSMARQSIARPGHAQRLNSEPTSDNEPIPKAIEDDSRDLNTDNKKSMQSSQKSLSPDENHHLDDECLQRFIKTNVRLMTEDRQTVAGTLLVTPNAVMFDPDVLDPLVKEHGIVKYGLIIKMDLLARIALYDDLSIYEHQSTFPEDENEKIWHSTNIKHVPRCSKTSILHSDEEEIQSLMASLLDKIDQELNSSNIADKPCKLFDATTSRVQRQRSKTVSDYTHDVVNDNDNDNDNDDDDDVFRRSKRTGSLSDDSCSPLDKYKHSLGIRFDDNEKHVNKTYYQVPSQICYVFDWTRFRRAVKVKKGCHLENCVPLDEFNKRFGEIDKLLHQQQQTYCTPRGSIEIPYYLCLKTSVHTDDIPSLHARQLKKNYEKSKDTTFEKKQLEQEYWFSISKDKIDQLYKFFLRWKPEYELNSLLDDDPSSSNTDTSKTIDQNSPKGFVLLANDDPELCIDKTEKKTKKQQHYLNRQDSLLKEWEIINVAEIYRRFNPQSNEPHIFDSSSIPAPKLLQPSTLITEELSKKILIELPNRLHSLDWYMVFSTETHGFSLSQLYRRSLEFERDMPVLVIVKDVEQNIFGAFVPHQLVVREGIYGTGESFLFTLLPEFRVFNWTGDNEFFVKGDINSIGFGIGEGTYGLWFDADLYHGRTCPCKTFNNECLSTSEDFIIASVEVWTFID